MIDLIRSFRFALLGIIDAIAHERNFRLQWLMGMLVLLALSLWDLDHWQQIVIVLLVFLVLSFELHNCAIEKTCDSMGRNHNHDKMRAKDFAAGGVLLFAIGSALLFSILIHYQLEIILESFNNNSIAYITWIIVLVLSLPLAVTKNAFAASLFWVGVIVDAGFVVLSHGEPLFLTLGAVFHAILTAVLMLR